MADAKAGNDVFTAVAVVTLGFMIVGSVFAFLELRSYSSTVPPAAVKAPEVPKVKTHEEAPPDKGGPEVTPPAKEGAGTPKPETGSGGTGAAGKEAGGEKPPVPPPAVP